MTRASSRSLLRFGTGGSRDEEEARTDDRGGRGSGGAARSGLFERTGAGVRRGERTERAPPPDRLRAERPERLHSPAARLTQRNDLDPAPRARSRVVRRTGSLSNLLRCVLE